MSKFLLTEVSEAHHKRCQDECQVREGAMLKCMNLTAEGNRPCQNVIHVSCAGYDLSVVPHMTGYFCTDCTTGSTELHQQLAEIEENAKKAAEKAKSSSKSQKEELEAWKEMARKLEGQLKEKIEMLQHKTAEIEELKKQQDPVKFPVPSTTSRTSETSGKFHSTLYDKVNETLRFAEGFGETSGTQSGSTHNIKSFNMSSIHHTSFDASNTSSGWPDYDEQQRVAEQYEHHRLTLMRASLAKPVPFDGDVTKWATFLSEFVRTSVRGSFRDFEDMDRLRDLIVGEAREMFVTELSDPCAEALPTLKRLDEFFGVRGNAVRVAMDRLAQLPRIDKATDKAKLKSLYTHAKQFALQCRIHNQQHDLASEAILFIIESKMFSEHVKAWRSWTKMNHKGEDVEGVIAYLEELIRELNFKSARTKPVVTAEVNTTDVTGGLRDGGTKSAPPSTSNSSTKSQGKSGKKKRNRYANCECFLCKEKHPFYKCSQFIAANDARRNEIVDQLQICTRCLCSKKHKVDNCPNKCLRCFISGCSVNNKHPLLHGHSNDQLPAFTTTSAQIDVRFLQTASHFPIVPGHVVAANGELIPVTIMYDSGSGISLATSSLFERANYESQMDYELILRWATDMQHTESQAKLFDLQFIPEGKTKPVTIKKVTATQSLSLPEQEQNAIALKERFPYLRDVPLPSYKRQVPQILLGLSHAKLMSHLSSISGEEGDPVAALTPLGWVLYGNCLDSCNRTEPIVLGFTCTAEREDDISNEELLNYIRSCNDVDSIGIAHREASLLSAEDQQAECIIKSTMRFIPSIGRYEIGLLWANESDNDTLPDNYDEAVNRLISIEKRLRKLGMLEFVQNQFDEQIQNGWLVETTREEVNKYPRRNYVYGFLTFNKNKTPPKPRWVNDTAARFRGTSLNSKLLKGPDNLVPLPQSMCSLREGQIAFQADVKSMFNQVMLKLEDQFSQLTLWRGGDPSIDPRIYRQTRVIFGPTSSPSITSSVRIDHARNCMDEFPQASEVALHQMYVDDAPDSRDTVEEAVKVGRDLITMFARIGWPLIEFQSNSTDFLKQIPQDHVSKKMVEVDNDTEEFITKVLGIFWKPQADVYVYRLNDDSIIRKCTDQNYMPTKREMLSTVMRIFDPLGQIAPFRIRGHMIMQHVWRAGTDWNKKPPKEICEEFTKWLKDFAEVAKLEIPRPYGPHPLNDCELTLHVFVDAGTEAYAACAYLRIQLDQQVIIRLVAAKARVAPLKYMSIPRLELMSGLIGARLLKSVLQWHRRLKIIDYNCWTDSDVVFKWIKSHHLPRTAFSAPRIAEIQELTSADKWRYVPSKQNVADYATKERQIDYSDASHEWFTGPAFLYTSIDEWPKQPSTSITKKVEASVNIATVENGKLQEVTTALSQVPAKIRADWPVLTRVVAKALRFADYILPQQPYHRRTGHLTNFELMRAENYVIREVQQLVFADEWKSLKRDGRIRKSSQLFSLSPFMCQQTNLIRATTRLSTNFPLNMRCPPIMPNFHELTDSMVKYYHHINLHVGDNAITAQLRSRAWIIHAKRAVRRCRARCLHCIQKRIHPAAPRMADLPDFRLEIQQKPFFHTGCDLFGPFTVYTGRSRRKTDVHVVIFTCMVTRAVYFEVLDDKSTANFLVAFDKLWARRGPISHVYSDNGLNFVGAARVIDADEVQKATAEKRITWHFNPAYAPQFGGAWERLIKDVKRGLDSSIGKFIVPRLSMEAALARIEANLNNRPLTEVPVSSMDETPITPHLLMTGYPNYPGMDDSSNNELSFPPDIMAIKPARRINALVQAFRHRFIAEYGPIITRRPTNSAKPKHMLKANDYVIYMDPTKNPSEWHRGVISKTYPGKDWAIRVADIKLKNGATLERRPAHLIAKLDIRFEDPEAESSKYTQCCNLLVNLNLNLLPMRGDSLSKTNSNLKIQKMSQEKSRAKLINKLEAQTSTNIKRAMNIQLGEDQKQEFIDYSGDNIVYATNFPSTFGAGDVYAIMADFGVVKMIATSSWSGIHPFSCFIGYEDSASVSTALLWNESQVICANNIAHRQTFEKLKKRFSASRTIQKPMFAMLNVQMPNNEPQQVLMITTSISDRKGLHKPLPITSDAGGFTSLCTRSRKYDFVTAPIDMSKGDVDIQKLPTVPKEEIVKDKEDNVEPCAHVIDQPSQENRSVKSYNGHIIVSIAASNSFESSTDYASGRSPDLREIINKRKEIKQLRDIICRPKSR